MRIQITNAKTGETTPIVRDVAHKHPDWVHRQCGTASESELQACLDGLNVSMWYRDGKHLGPDVAGVEMFQDEDTLTINGVEVSLLWGEGPGLGRAVHTVPADKVGELGPCDGYVFELHGRKYRLGSHDYSTDQPGCEDDKECTCEATIYLA